MVDILWTTSTINHSLKATLDGTELVRLVNDPSGSPVTVHTPTSTFIFTAAIGVTVQAYSANLASWSAVSTASYYTSAQVNTLLGGYQPLAANLTDISGLSNADNNFIVGNGSNFVAESGNTARTSLGVGTGDSPQFLAVNIGAAADTTITRVSAGVIAVEGVTVLMTSNIGVSIQAYSSNLDLWAAVVPSDYLTTASAAATYLTIANAASTYLTQANAASTYLTIANAASTYLTIANAASTYLTIANAASTYQPLNVLLTKISGLSIAPGIDQGIFYDTSASAIAYFTPTSGLEFNGVSLRATTNLRTRDIIVCLGQGGSVITTGTKGEGQADFTGVIQSATILADQSGSIVIDIWKDTYANYPPTIADSIVASAPPTLSGAAKFTDSTLTGWTTAVTAGDTFKFNVNSIASCTRVTLIIKCLVT